MVEFQVIFTFIFEYLDIFLVYTNDNNETNTFQKMLFFPQMELNSLMNYKAAIHFHPHWCNCLW